LLIAYILMPTAVKEATKETIHIATSQLLFDGPTIIDLLFPSQPC
jgi:hypothetical protein